MDLLTIFLCLALFAERKPGEEMENFFSYELTPYPNFFSKLKNYLLENVITFKGVDYIKVADGEALLW